MKKGLVVVGILSFLLAGCSTTGSSAKETDREVQEISVSLPAELTTLDTTQTTDKVTFTVIQHLFEGSYRFDEKSQPVPGLAEEAVISEDGKTYTFKLKEEAKWSDGQQVQAADFAYAWKKLVDPKTMGPNAYLLDNVVNSQDIREGKADIAMIGLETPDEKTFVVHLEQPQPSFLSVVSIGWLAPQRQSYVEEKGTAYGKTSEDLLYTGPFILKDWQQTGAEWTLAKNPEYYDQAVVKLDKIKGSTIKEENTGIQLFESGELDLQKISGLYVQQYQNNDSLVTQKDIANYFLDFNKQANKPLANVHLRKAIALAIDKESLVNDVLNDGASVLNGLIPSGLYANPNTNEDFRTYSGDYNEYDSNKAQAEWSQAQSAIGDKIELTLLVTDDDHGQKIGEYLQNQLQDHLPGLTITINKQPRTNLNQSRADGQYELSISGWIAGSSDLDSYFNLYKKGSSYNYGGYVNEDYTALTENARTVDANDPDKVFEDYKSAESILLAEDAAQVPLYQSASNYLIRSTIKDIQFPAYGAYFYFRTASVEK
ncbi:peptide ABC transporter substrate-binding protein [Enterococcus faecium]|uniref:peptide ABC transporter substrate-binding protein n=1 Tax=Enterococcus faecium TaxID=1352 RepID=UPI0013F45D97|nr:peptide ABC transporter substrate-binding protein [Enterococcus faecium]MCM6869572.1 peptide ABC transporter substrate-binding protein [Enterococcus faecium]MCM6878324.1 peptide ABC transporter substrate-binding protein [Enterococcus faecium]MCM6887367.1 peptide ABC transporter substrate-binding protein [Enterococcus faecium]MCM6890134.1 peptide ABC transporter substrate-binding protein [Enterococcus faecium]MCM6909032.1 peptide ABC transporter substrate-binding protein [Enterococcus faeciu